MPLLSARGVRLLVLGPGGAEDAARLAGRRGVAVAADPSGRALDALGCTAVIGPFRRSGTVLLDERGTVRFAVRAANPSAALPWGQVVTALSAMWG